MMADFNPPAPESTPPRDAPPAGSEALCALFDGELDPDAARFALKRLGRDAAWRDSCGRWQMLGDVMRGVPQAVAPAGFADRVAQALGAAQGSAQVAAAGGASARATSRRWIPGAALAASVAVAALLVGRPLLEDRPVSASGGIAAAQPQRSVVEATPGVQALQPSDPAVDGAAGAAASAALAAVERARRRGPAQEPVRVARSRSASEESLASAAPEPAAGDGANSRRWAAPATATTPASAAELLAAGTPEGTPFRMPADPAPVRPWPRSVLPGYPSAGGLTASFGDRANGPSFYPFEPGTVLPPLESVDPPPEQSRQRR